MTVHLQLGLPEHLRPAAAVLYWQAFGGKLGRVMGPDKTALRYLEQTIRADHVIIAVNDAGDLLGMAGFKTPAGSFAGGSWADIRLIYGLAGLIWRAPLLAMLSREVDNDRFLVDGICVASNARSMGIGTALLRAIDQEARDRGYSYVRLDVIDSNWRAKALYERVGFMTVKTTPIGMLRHVFGFDAAVTMVKPV